LPESEPARDAHKTTPISEPVTMVKGVADIVTPVTKT